MVFFVNAISERFLSESQGGVIPETPKVSLLVPSSPWRPAKNEDTACSPECIEAPLLPLQPRPTCERLELPFSSHPTLSGFKDYLLRIGSIHHVEKMSHQDILTEHVVDIHKVVSDFRDAFERNESSSSQLPNHLCRKGSASTTGTLGRDVERKMLSRNKLRGNGILLPCKKHLTMLITICFKNDFT